MPEIKQLFGNNREWAERLKAEDPEFFSRLAKQQKPEYLWIGCSDSRVPANEIVGLLPGELFVHRNVANQVIHTDLNCLSVLQYAVDMLKVKHIVVCGHYGCGGVVAAMQSQPHGLVDNWLRHIRDVYQRHHGVFSGIRDSESQVDRLCELNVIEQVANVCHTTVVQDAWHRGQDLAVHGWIYSIRDGVLHDLEVSFREPNQVPEVFRMDQTGGGE